MEQSWRFESINVILGQLAPSFVGVAGRINVALA
jgi:hypothetical protein